MTSPGGVGDHGGNANPYWAPGTSPGPYAAGAPVGRPAPHVVDVKPSGGNIAAQIGATLICLGVGISAVVTAIQKPDVEGRSMALIIGSIFALVGLGLALMLRRVLRTRRYTFTETALEGETHAGKQYTLPWSAVESIVIQAKKHRPLWKVLFYRHLRNRSTGFMRVELRPGAELTGVAAPMARQQRVAIPFWNRPELIDSLAYGCKTFAAAKFRGVNLL